MTRAQHARALFWGRVAHWLLLALPTWRVLEPFEFWLLPYAGFYAYDTGYDDYVWRSKSRVAA